MSHSTIKTGQLDLAGLQDYFTTNISGSSSNTSGFYPYTGNPADFAHSGYIDAVSGDISGYIDSVSGILSTRVGESGVALSGYTASIQTSLKSDVSYISGRHEELSGLYVSTKALSLENQADIDTLSGVDLLQTGQDLSLLITGASGAGVSGFVTGFVDTTSGALNTKISNLNTDLRDHVKEDYLSKRNESESVSGTVFFEKTPRFKQSVELERVGDHDEVTTYQSGINIYCLVSGITEAGAAHQSMPTFLRYPQSGDNVRQNLIVGSFQYSGVIP